MAADPVRSKADQVLVQRVLRGGLVMAAVLMVGGLVADVAGNDLAAAPVRLGGLLRDGTVGDRLMAVGILVLSLTPFARVVTLIGLWTRERDRRFVAVGIAVLAVLATSLALGVG